LAQVFRSLAGEPGQRCDSARQQQQNRGDRTLNRTAISNRPGDVSGGQSHSLQGGLSQFSWLR